MSEPARMVRFVLTGGLNAGFGYASYAAFVLAGAPLWLAVVGATSLALLFNFFSYGGLVFGDVSLRLLPAFLAFYSVLGGLNYAALRLLTGAALDPLLAQAMLLPLLALFGYAGMRAFVFGSVPLAVEDFRPVPVRRETGLLGRILYAVRLVVDLQLLTCQRFVAPHLSQMTGTVLDVGCGEMPFRALLGPEARYVGIDVPQAGAFGMRSAALPFDGHRIPFGDASFDHVLCTEVLEHAEDPVALIAEMHRVLRPGGTLLATVPFAARVHFAPHDFNRFTRFALVRLFASFGPTEVIERGDDLAVIANKLIVVCARLVQPAGPVALLCRLPLLVIAGSAATLALAVAHLSLAFGWGSRLDPLGYGIRAVKV